MKAYEWEDDFGESHIVVVAESLEKARELAQEEVTRMYGDPPGSFHRALLNEPTQSDLPFVVTYYTGE